MVGENTNRGADSAYHSRHVIPTNRSKKRIVNRPVSRKVRLGSNISVTISLLRLFNAILQPDGFDVGHFFFCYFSFGGAKEK